MSTLLPATVRDIAARLCQLCFLDAPVSGRLVKAREGAFAIMAVHRRMSPQRARFWKCATAAQVLMQWQAVGEA